VKPSNSWMQDDSASSAPLLLLLDEKSRLTSSSIVVDMSARSDDSAAAAAEACDAALAVPASATVEAMAAGAALSPPASPRASFENGNIDASTAPFAFDTARLSRSPPRSPPGMANARRGATSTAQPSMAAEVVVATGDATMQREPFLSPEPTAIDGIVNGSVDASASASSSAAAAAAAAAALAHESAATDFVRTRRAIQLRLVLEIERKLRLVR